MSNPERSRTYSRKKFELVFFVNFQENRVKNRQYICNFLILERCENRKISEVPQQIFIYYKLNNGNIRKKSVGYVQS